jgi:3-hydroxyacyl-[acyl-carrier-protein] dehydratase
LREIRTLGHLNQYLKDKIAGAQTAPPVKVYSREHIAVVLPQQPPFMFLDEAEMNGDKVTARYLIKGDEFFLAGHFKDEPIFPASIQFEAIGQAACLWVLEKIPTLLGHPIPTNQIFFASLDGARLFRKARPGQQLVIEVKLTKFRDPVAMFQGHITVDGQRTAQIEQLMLAFGDQIAPEQPASPQPDAPPPAATPAPTA